LSQELKFDAFQTDSPVLAAGGRADSS